VEQLISLRWLFGGKEDDMSKIIERCAGIDVGKRFGYLAKFEAVNQTSAS
jgi:uncharacterized Fe-S cluster-containing radical SAM superfamily enzyme